ncbi:MAG: penicillin-binding transpeptidase domain-containing protein, partial [Bacillota bacterium]|nr:penicillin-binding transpeptidase domain-containing protein [Bacillota bacterium]
MMALDRIKPVDLAVMSFGQTLTVTPIQLASAVACIANDGLMMKPRVVREIRSAEGTLVREVPPEPLRQVISKQSAAEMRGALEKVIEEGTGKGAQVEGYNLAGKTGTAQKVVNGRIAEGKYIASFVGFGPSESPRVVTLVFIDEPAGAYYGGVIAAPVFAAVMGDVLRYLEVPRQTVANSQTPASAVAVAVPDVINMTLDQARKKMESAGLSLKVQTQGKVVAKQVPSPGSLTPKGSMVVVEMGPAEVTGQDGKLVLVPKLAGLTMREAAGVLSTFDLRIAATGSGVATSQQPAAGTYCHAGAVVTVKFSPGGP